MIKLIKILDPYKIYNGMRFKYRHIINLKFSKGGVRSHPPLIKLDKDFWRKD